MTPFMVAAALLVAVIVLLPLAILAAVFLMWAGDL